MTILTTSSILENESSYPNATRILTTTTTTIPNEEQSNQEYRELFTTAQQITGLYLMPLVSCFGIFGNVCNVLVFAHSKKYSTNAYLIVLALSDILKLANDFIYFLVTLIGKLDSKLAEHLFESLYLYSHYVFVLTAINTAWLTCVIAIDRYVTVSSRNQVKSSETNYCKSILIGVAITAMSGLIALPSPLFLKPELESRYNRTSRTEPPDAFIENSKKFYNYFNAAFRAFIPIILLIYLNYKIIMIVYKNNKTRKNMSKKPSNGGVSHSNGHHGNGGGGGGSGAGGDKSRVTTMLLVIIFSFVICVFPDAILTMMHLGYANEGYLIRAIREVTDMLLAINSAITFLICYAFSYSYRLIFKEIFGCRDERNLRNNNNNNNNNNKNNHNYKTKSTAVTQVLCDDHQNHNNEVGGGVGGDHTTLDGKQERLSLVNNKPKDSK